MHSPFARMDRRLLLRRERREAARGHKRPAGEAYEITIRPSTPEDTRALLRLAQLDGRRPPSGEFILAIVGEELWAALPLGGGDAIADPFRPTTDLVTLLRVRDAAMRDAGAGGRRAPRCAAPPHRRNPDVEPSPLPPWPSPKPRVRRA